MKSDDGKSPQGTACTTRAGSYGEQSHLLRALRRRQNARFRVRDGRLHRRQLRAEVVHRGRVLRERRLADGARGNARRRRFGGRGVVFGRLRRTRRGRQIWRVVRDHLRGRARRRGFRAVAQRVRRVAFLRGDAADEEQRRREDAQRRAGTHRSRAARCDVDRFKTSTLENKKVNVRVHSLLQRAVASQTTRRLLGVARDRERARCPAPAASSSARRTR